MSLQPTSVASWRNSAIGVLRETRSGSGFTLPEALVVLTLVSVLLLWSLPLMSPTQRRLHALRNDYENILSLVDRGRFGAMTGSSDWLLLLDCTANPGFSDRCTLHLGPNDGWLGNPVSGVGSLGLRSKTWQNDPNSAVDFDSSERSNSALTATEEVASFSLSAHASVLPSLGFMVRPAWIKFRTDGTIQTDQGHSSVVVLWIADDRFSGTVSDPNNPLPALDGQTEFAKPIVIFPTGAIYLPNES